MDDFDGILGLSPIKESGGNSFIHQLFNQNRIGE